VYCRTCTNEPCREPGEAELMPADEEKNHWEAGDRDRYYRGRTGTRTPLERERMVRFYRMFDAWLEQVRDSGNVFSTG